MSSRIQSELEAVYLEVEISKYFIVLSGASCRLTHKYWRTRRLNGTLVNGVRDTDTVCLRQEMLNYHFMCTRNTAVPRSRTALTRKVRERNANCCLKSITYRHLHTKRSISRWLKSGEIVGRRFRDVLSVHISRR